MDFAVVVVEYTNFEDLVVYCKDHKHFAVDIQFDPSHIDYIAVVGAAELADVHNVLVEFAGDNFAFQESQLDDYFHAGHSFAKHF
jgi:hypothetical protein